jgi:hypothetical protein
MSVLGACWHRPILGKNQGSAEKWGEHAENEEHTRIKGKPTPRKVVTKWTNCCAEQLESGQAPTWRMVGSRTSRD